MDFSIWERLPHRNVQRFRGGIVFKAYRLCVSLNSRRESNKGEERGFAVPTRNPEHETRLPEHETWSPGTRNPEPGNPVTLVTRNPGIPQPVTMKFEARNPKRNSSPETEKAPEPGTQSPEPWNPEIRNHETGNPDA